VLDDVETDGSIRVVVVRGAAGTFISEADIEDVRDFDVVDGLAYQESLGQELYTDIADLREPTLAAVEGYALGGRLEIATACDIRLATTDAQFGLPEIEVGMFPAGGSTNRLVNLIGTGTRRN